MSKRGYTYILTNKRHTVLYIGVTSNLEQRLQAHKFKLRKNCFTAKYNVDKLVYYAIFEHMEEAIKQEKWLKSKTRAKKIALINSMNEPWHDLDFHHECSGQLSP